MSDRRVGFTGPFSDVNFGDYAMLVNNVLDLDPARSVLFSYDAEFVEDVRRHYLAPYAVDVVDVRLDLEASDGRRGVWQRSPIDVLGQVRDLAGLTRTVEGIDALVVSGGGFLNGLWTMPHRLERLLAILAPALVASHLGKPIVFTGNGYGPFGEHEEFFFSLLNSLRNVTFGARDSLYSCAELRRLGVPDASIVEVPDDLFLMHPGLLSKTPSAGPDRDYVILETYQPVEYLREHESALRSFATCMAQEHGLAVVPLPFHRGPGGSDQAEYLSEVLGSPFLYDLPKRGFLPIEDAVALIAGAELVVASRYHAQVVAASQGTPVVSVLRDVLGDKRYYYGKCRGLLDRVMGDGPVDETLYLQTSLTQALAVVASDFVHIVEAQSRQLATHLPEARERLARARASLLSRV